MCKKRFQIFLMGLLLLGSGIVSAFADPVISAIGPSPAITPSAPLINAKAYVLMDAHSGHFLVAQNDLQRIAPASLTKMMTSYIISAALQQGQFRIEDKVPISEGAWATGGSKMFIKVGDTVSVQDLMQGIIVDSGNDACVAMAEFVAGSQDAFVQMMNQEAAHLGMTGTHFMDVNGLPNPDHYTTAHDMALLARALIYDFPQDYKWYSQKWFTYNHIKQSNRNRLLWHDPTVDGVKTGHTDEAGFCLVASAQRGDMRLISVVMNAPTDQARAVDSAKLLNYGFRFFESKKLYDVNTVVVEKPIRLGDQTRIRLGMNKDFYVTFPVGAVKNSQVKLSIESPLKAPIKKGQSVGQLQVLLPNGQIIGEGSIVALDTVERGNGLHRLFDQVSLLFHKG